jgi:hypothetical protein
MGTQQTKADISPEQASTLASAPSSRCLGIQFCPAVAFAVSCKPAETKPADKQHKGGRSSMDRTYRLADNVGSRASNALGNACAPGQA